MKTVTVQEFKDLIKKQGRDRIEDATFICPQCKTIQSAQDLIDAGAGKDFDEVNKYLAFSCVGRWSKTKGCNWTLGGLFQLHELEIVDENGERHPRFEPMIKEKGEE